MTHDEKETRVLQYIEGELTPGEEQALLAEAQNDPELAALLEEYRRQESLLRVYHENQAVAADRVRHPDLATLPSARVVPVRRVPTRWLMAAAAAVALVAGTAGTLAYRNAHLNLGTVEHSAGAVRAFTDGKLVALAPGRPIEAAYERLKTPEDGSLEIGMASGGSLELNENSTVRILASGKRPDLELDRGEVLVTGSPAVVRTPWFAAEGSAASFSVSRGLRGAEVAVARGTVEIRLDGTRRQLAAGQAWNSTGSRTLPVAERIAWSRHAGELGAKTLASVAPAPTVANQSPGKVTIPEVAVTASAPAVAAVTSSQPLHAATTGYLPAGTIGFVEISDASALLARVGAGGDFSEALLGDRLRQIALRGIDQSQQSAEERERSKREINEFFDDPNLNLVLSSLRGSLSLGITDRGPILVAEVTNNRASVENAINVTLREKFGIPPEGTRVDRLMMQVVDGNLVLGFDRDTVAGTINALAMRAPTEFANSSFLLESRDAAGFDAPLIAASDIKTLYGKVAQNDRERLFFRRLGWQNLRTIVASPAFADDTDNRALQVRFDGPRQGVMAWLGKPGPISGFEFFSPDTHALTAARIESPLRMLQQLVTWQVESRGLQIESLEGDETYLAMNELASTLGNEVVIGLDNPILPVPNVKIAIELRDPANFHDGMLGIIDRFAANRNNAPPNVTSSTYRNHLIVDVQIPGRPVGISYAVVDDYAVIGPGRPFLQAAIDTYIDRRSIDQEPAFVQALPAKSGSNVSWLMYVAHNKSLQDATPYLAQMFSQHGAPIDLNAVSESVPGRSMVMYAIADDDRIDYYIEGIKGDFQMTGMLPAVTQWLTNGS